MRELHKIIRDEMLDRKREMERTKSIPSELRNKKCPCGSGRKSKNCHCDEFKGGVK